MEHENQPREAWEPGFEPLRLGKVHGAVTGRWRGGGQKTHTVYPIKYLVVTGDLTTGFVFHGSFNSHVRADRWATDNLGAGTTYKVHNMYDIGSD